MKGIVRVFEITGITDDRDRSIEVVLADTGERMRFPKSQVEFAFRRIIVPEWLARKILNEKLIPDLS